MVAENLASATQGFLIMKSSGTSSETAVDFMARSHFDVFALAENFHSMDQRADYWVWDFASIEL